MKNRFAWAMSAYVLLAILAGFTLTGDEIVSKMRYAVWVLLAGLAFKTWIAHKTQR
jgi:hypothetical protein